MDPQAPNIPSVEVKNPDVSQNTPVKENNSMATLAVAVFIILALGAVVFLYYQNQQLKNMLANYQVPATPTPIVMSSPTPNPETPSVSSPSANMKVVSPLKIAGTVPAGWMFEGVFPIKLVDSNRKLIVQGQAKEKVAGSWQNGQAVDFTATLTFKSVTGSGFLILQNDNPSGDPANSKTFEVPVKFSEVITSPTPIASAPPIYSKEGESCGALAGAAGNAQCAPGLTCQHQDPNNYNIGTCAK
jgi:hypothetical protein